MKKTYKVLIPVILFVALFPGLFRETLIPLERRLKKPFKEEILVKAGVCKDRRDTIKALQDLLLNDKTLYKEYGEITYNNILDYLDFRIDTSAFLTGLSYDRNILLAVANPKDYFVIKGFGATGKHDFVCTLLSPDKDIVVTDLWLNTPGNSCGVSQHATPSRNENDSTAFFFHCDADEDVNTIREKVSIDKIKVRYNSTTTELIDKTIAEETIRQRNATYPRVQALLGKLNTID